MTRTIKATPNYRKRTFTLRTSTGFKYRTECMNKEDFNSCLNNTTNDWAYYLKSNQSYTKA